MKKNKDKLWLPALITVLLLCCCIVLFLLPTFGIGLGTFMLFDRQSSAPEATMRAATSTVGFDAAPDSSPQKTATPTLPAFNPGDQQQPTPTSSSIGADSNLPGSLDGGGFSNGALETLRTLEEVIVPPADLRELAMRLSGVEDIPKTLASPDTDRDVGAK